MSNAGLIYPGLTWRNDDIQWISERVCEEGVVAYFKTEWLRENHEET